MGDSEFRKGQVYLLVKDVTGKNAKMPLSLSEERRAVLFVLLLRIYPTTVLLLVATD